MVVVFISYCFSFSYILIPGSVLLSRLKLSPGNSFPSQNSPLFGHSDFAAKPWICAAIVRCFGEFICTLQRYMVQSLEFAFFQTYIESSASNIFDSMTSRGFEELCEAAAGRSAKTGTWFR